MSCVRSAMDAGPRCAPAPLVTGKRPAKSLSLSTSLPWASVMLKACTSCRLGPRVGVSVTRYAFKLPRSVTITRELGVIGKSLAARDCAHLYYLYKRNRSALQLRACPNCPRQGETLYASFCPPRVLPPR